MPPRTSPLAFLVMACISVGCGSRASTPDLVQEERAVPLEYIEAQSPFGDIDLELVSTIGSDEEEDYLFTRLDGMQVAPDGKLYVLDRGMKNLRVFDQHGVLVKKHEFVEGEGPGEFRNPNNVYAFTLSENGARIYFNEPYWLTVLTQDFAFIDVFPINTPYPAVASEINSDIIVLYGSFGMAEDCCLIHILDASGTQITEFGTKQANYWDLFNRDLQGFSNTFLRRADSLLFFAYSAPYEIRKYTLDGKLLHRFTREVPFFGGDFLDPQGNFQWVTGMIGELTVIDASLILVFASDVENRQHYIHAFDADGRDRGIIHLNEVSQTQHPFLNTAAASGDSLLYLEALEPYPHIQKYRILQRRPAAPS